MKKNKQIQNAITDKMVIEYLKNMPKDEFIDILKEIGFDTAMSENLYKLEKLNSRITNIRKLLTELYNHNIELSIDKNKTIKFILEEIDRFLDKITEQFSDEYYNYKDNEEQRILENQRQIYIEDLERKFGKNE